MSMAITKESYKDLKEYWDYQRKVQYNKEVVQNMADQFQGRVYNDFGQVDLQQVKNILWDRVSPNDYEEPRYSIAFNTWIEGTLGGHTCEQKVGFNG